MGVLGLLGRQKSIACETRHAGFAPVHPREVKVVFGRRLSCYIKARRFFPSSMLFFEYFFFGHVKRIGGGNLNRDLTLLMHSTEKGKVRAIVVLSCLCALLVTSSSWADARSEYLINMLESGSSYRVKVQAATTLGKIRCRDAVPALGRALSDEHELVVIAAAAALGQIGEPSVIPALQEALRNPPSDAALSQLEATMRVLKALTGEGEIEDAQAAETEFLVRVDAMGNSSTSQREDLTDLMRDTVVQVMRRQPGVVLQEPGLKPSQVKSKLKKDKLRGYILSGSVLRMEHVGDQMIVKISLNVFSNPDYNLLMMPSAEGAVAVIDGPLTRETEQSAQEKALKAVIEALVGKVFETLHTSDSP